MMSSRRPLIAAIVAVSGVALSGCGGSTPSSSGVLTIDEPSGAVAVHGVAPPHPLSVGTTALPDASASTPGASFALAPPTGQLNLVFFGYTNCPDVCPGTLNAVGAAMKDIGADARNVSLVMVSVDPTRDSAQRMRAYVGQFIPAGRGHGLRTDDRAALAAAQKTLGIVATPDEQSGVTYIDHTGALFAVAPGGRVLLEWPYGSDPKDLASDITELRHSLHQS